MRIAGVLISLLTLSSVFGQKQSYAAYQLVGTWEVVKMKVENESVLEADREFIPPKRMLYTFYKGDKCSIDVTNKKTGQRTSVNKYWEFYSDDNSIEFFDQQPVKNQVNSGPYKLVELVRDSFKMYCCIDGKCFTYWLERRPDQ